MKAEPITGNGIINNPMIIKDLYSNTLKSFDTKFTNFPIFASFMQKLDKEDTLSYKAFMNKALKLAKKYANILIVEWETTTYPIIAPPMIPAQPYIARFPFFREIASIKKAMQLDINNFKVKQKIMTKI